MYVGPSVELSASTILSYRDDNCCITSVKFNEEETDNGEFFYNAPPPTAATAQQATDLFPSDYNQQTSAWPDYEVLNSANMYYYNNNNDDDFIAHTPNNLA